MTTGQLSQYERIRLQSLRNQVMQLRNANDKKNQELEKLLKKIKEIESTKTKN